MLNSEGLAEPVPPLTDPAPYWTLQQDSWCCFSWESSLCTQGDCPTPKHGHGRASPDDTGLGDLAPHLS